MPHFPEDLNEDPQERLAARAEYLDIAQDEQIAEGDISTSETETGQIALPELDDREIEDELLGEDDLELLDEDDPELGFAYTEEDLYLTDDDEADDWDEFDDLDDEDAYR